MCQNNKLHPNISLNHHLCGSYLAGLIDEVGDVCVSHSGNISVAAAAAAAGHLCSRRGGRRTRRLLTSNLVQKTESQSREFMFCHF